MALSSIKYTGPPGFAQYEDLTYDLDDASLSLIKCLKLATPLVEGDDSAATDFTAEVLQAMGYEHRNTVVRRRKTLRLDMCGEEVYTQANIGLIGVNYNILLVVQEDKSHINPAADPRAQLVTDAIAVFQVSNANRINRLFLPALESQVVPGITMTGTFPRFYKTHVTSTLDLCIRGGLCPPLQTPVHRHMPPVVGRPSEGMTGLANRVIILGCYEAFKKFVYQQ